jgi:hypothetical protein
MLTIAITSPRSFPKCPFEGVVDRLDELADLLEHRLAEPLDLVLVRRPQ